MDDTSKTLKPWVTFAGCVLVVVVLYWAQAVLVPIALAILLTFVLTPPVTWLQRWIGRIPAVLAMVTLVFTVLGLAGWGLARQMDHLAEDLPRYRVNILAKIADVRGAGKGGSVEKLQETIEDIKTDLGKSDVRHRNAGRGPSWSPLSRSSGFSGFTWLGPIVGPLGTAGLVLAMVIFMLLERRDLRDRLIGLFGHGQLAMTTKAFDEAGTRVSRQLLMQSLVNLIYGIAAGAGLYLLGVPYPLVWAALACGAPIHPVRRAGARCGRADPGQPGGPPGLDRPAVRWSACSSSSSCSRISCSKRCCMPGRPASRRWRCWCRVAFWTWLWGPLGLLMATPLTVCLVVLGKHVPGLEFVGTLMADTPALAPEYGYYQRLLARDQSEAADLIERHIKTEPPRSVYDALLLPALNYAERDRLEAAPVGGRRNGRHRCDTGAALRRRRGDPAPESAAPRTARRSTTPRTARASACAGSTRSTVSPTSSRSGCSSIWWTICQSPSTSPRRACRPPNWCRWCKSESSRWCASPICHPARRRRRAISSRGSAPRCPRCASWSGAGHHRRWRTRARRCCGRPGRITWASTLVETREYLGGLVEIPRIPVPGTVSVGAQAA